MGARRTDPVDLLRSAGGLLLAIGVIVLLSRKSTSDLARALLTVVPAILLYTMSVLAPPPGGGDEARPWRGLLAIAAVLLAPIAMVQVLHLLGANVNARLWEAGVLALTSLLAAHAARRTGATYLVLLSALAALATWLVLWLLASPSVATTRWLLIAGAVLLFAAAFALRGAPGAREVASVGGFAAVLPGAINVIGSYFVVFANGVSDLSSKGEPLIGQTRLPALETFGWDLYLLVASILLVWLASRVRSRGLGYAGGFGIVTFVLGVGSQLTRLEAGRAPETGIGGWPVALIVAGVVALLLPALLRSE